MYVERQMSVVCTIVYTPLNSQILKTYDDREASVHKCIEFTRYAHYKAHIKLIIFPLELCLTFYSNITEGKSQDEKKI